MLISPPPNTVEALTSHLERLRLEAANNLDQSDRANLGQFLTPAPIARQMASMFISCPEELRLLDAGAGTGSLTVALVSVATEWRQKPRSIHATLFEIDPTLSSYIQTTMTACAQVCRDAGINFTYNLINSDFVSNAVARLSDQIFLFNADIQDFNFAILNPPYLKINSGSPTRKSLRTVGIETGNYYAAFVWLASKLLVPGGELVAITPRSFCNGPYFKPFRLAFLESMALTRIHNFESRNQTFSEDNVLQENIVYHAIKSSQRPDTVKISTSSGAGNETIKFREVSYSQVVHPDDSDAFIHLVL